MNGQQGSDPPAPGSQESHLAYLLNSAAAGGHGAAGLLGYPGAFSAVQRLGFGGGDAASLEEQILQRASALRAEAFLQQQQQQHHHQQSQQRHHFGAALAALQQQQQLAALAMHPSHLSGLSAQEQELLLGRAAALRELGAGASGSSMDRLQQLEFGRLEELERRRQQIAALAGLSGAPTAPRPTEVASAADKMHPPVKSEGTSSSKATIPSSDTASTHDTTRTKEDLRKTPGTVIVPCRARGMPMDHNFKTAYFVIAEDTKHGEDLVCSYYSCRNGGVKFRYCAHCMAPVAKRNFCRRHDHGLSDKSLHHEADDDESMDESKGVMEEEVTTKTQPLTSSLDILSSAATGSISSPVSTKPGAAPRKRQKTQEATMPVATEDDHGDAKAGQAHISAKRRKAWSALLDKRPRTKDPRHLSSWLNEVLAVSDFDNELDLDGPESVSPTTAKADAESEVDPSLAKQLKKTAREKKKRKSGGDKTDSKSNKVKIDAKPKQKKAKEEKFSAEKEPMPVDGEVGKLSSEEERDQQGEEHPLNGNVEAIAENEVPDNKSSTADVKVEEPVTSPEDQGETPPETASHENREADEDGFTGSFADWRDRKKEKVKKSVGSLKK